MSFKFGEKSLSELHGVDDRLQAVCHRALEITQQDFAVHDGLRTREEQAQHVASGASETMNSKHLLGLAVDLVPVIAGKLRWQHEPGYAIAFAMRQAARELNVPIRWGCAWDINFTDSLADPQTLVEGYVARRQAQGKKVFLDNPHYELI